jgi:sulfatase modifying factor 1
MPRGGWLVVALAVLGCTNDDDKPQPAGAGSAPWEVSSPVPPAEPGMVWIPPGVLIAGTPPERLPRVADEEMAGEQVVMTGFHIDQYAYPNEVGAIPTTNLTRDEARGLCESQGKRLCTELEWERACKGPENLTYPYGDRYQASLCGTETGRTLIPNGVNAACRSGYDVYDLHGGVWHWTASDWGRGSTDPDLVAIRGGNGEPGELVGRCANGRPAKAGKARKDIGFRCCKGDVNSFQVVLSVTKGEPLQWRPPDNRISPQLAALVPDTGLVEGPASGSAEHAADRKGDERSFVVERMWVWRPLGNEELVLGGGCGRPGPEKVCGVVIARMRMDRPVPLAFVAADRWQPTLGQTDTPRELYLYGGDENGAFRKKVSYEWGRVGVGEKSRKKRRKGQSKATYD